MLQIAALGIVGYYPQLVNYLPKRLQLTADTAPPPRNPKLQQCVEQYVSEQFTDNGDNIKSVIASARSLDYSVLPDKLAKSMTESFDHAENSIGLMAEANARTNTVNEGAAEFRPVHEKIRDIRIFTTKIDTEIEEIETQLSRLNDDEPKRSKLTQHIEELKTEREKIEATTPENWEQVRGDYTELQLAERKQRTEFRKAADKGYQPVAKLQSLLAATSALKELGGEFEPLADKITFGNDMEETIDLLAASSKRFGDVEGASKIKSQLSKARKALKAKKPSAEKAHTALLAAQAEYESELQWREEAQASLGQQIADYEQTIRSTIGIRQQSKLSKEQALYVASCDAGHRDISLNF